MARSKPKASPTRDVVGEKRRKAITEIGSLFAGFKPASTVLTRVRAVPTCFVQLDHATRVGGWPTERFTLVHGPSSGGKTTFVLGLIRSFIEKGHYALFVDLERTTPEDWARAMLGEEQYTSKRFLAFKADTLEDTRDRVHDFLMMMIAAKDSGRLSKDASAIIVLDSIAKLVPRDQFETMLKEKAGDGDSGMDGMKGRSAMRRAALVKAWLDELIPLLDKSGAVMVAIGRETEDPNADVWARKTGNDFKVGGGKHVVYDASIVARIELAGFVYDERKGEKKVIAERHRVTIRKSKIGGKDGVSTVCFFFTRVGEGDATGFDWARDLVALGTKFGVIEKSGAWLSFGKERLGNGEHASVDALLESPELFARVDAAVRAKFRSVEPLEINDATGEVL